MLLAGGASCDVRDNDHGSSPIGFANYAGNFDMRDRLLDHSADASVLVCFGRVDRLDAILSEDPKSASVRDQAGLTPLHHLEVAGQAGAQVIETLLRHGADINARTDDGKTPLTVALDRDDDDVVELLRSHGCGRINSR